MTESRPFSAHSIAAPSPRGSCAENLWSAGEPDWTAVLRGGDVHLHLYGKAEPRRGRKMGHLTVTGATADEAVSAAVACRAHVGGGARLDR